MIASLFPYPPPFLHPITYRFPIRVSVSLSASLFPYHFPLAPDKIHESPRLDRSGRGLICEIAIPHPRVRINTHPR
jgi:hypothetical protein